MKIFNCNWESVLNLSVIWNDIPEESRAYFISEFIESVTNVEDTDSTLTNPLIKGGFLTLSTSGKKYTLSKAARQFHRLLKNIEQHDIFNKDNNRLSNHINYLKSFYTNEERQDLTEEQRGYRKDDEDLVMQIGCARWLSRFLSKEIPQTAKTEPLLFSKRILEALILGNNPIPLTDIFILQNDRDAHTAAKTIRSLLHNIFIYISIDANTYRPVMGIHPSIHSFINAKNVELQTTDCPTVECPPFIIDDLTTLLVNMSLKPIPIKQKDHEPYAKSVKEIASRFYKLPDECNFMHTYTDEDRMTIAVQTAQSLSLASLDFSAGKISLKAQDSCKKWLKLPKNAKLENVMRTSRNFYQSKKNEDLTRNGIGEYFDWFEIIEALQEKYSRREANPELTGSLFNAFKKLASPGGPVEQHAFIQDQVFFENPYFTLFHSQKPFLLSSGWYNNDYCIDYKNMVDAWYRELSSFIINWVIPFGLINLGKMKDANSYAISVNTIGKYFLGEIETLPKIEAPSVSSILVQPNFEIVFMGPDPAAEVQIGQFSDRLASGVGTLFKISRSSILKSTSIGFDAEFVLRTLKNLSEKPLPSNVKEQIKNWSAQCRMVNIKKRILFTCPDKETALKIKASGKDKVEQISDTVIAVADSKFAKTLAKKLEAKGIFKKSE